MTASGARRHLLRLLTATVATAAACALCPAAQPRQVTERIHLAFCGAAPRSRLPSAVGTSSRRGTLVVYPRRHKSQRPSRVAAAGLGAIWASSGVGPVVASTWARLAPIPPFSWADWIFDRFQKAPKLYKYYIYYVIINAATKALVPGLHAQVVTGTQLGVLKVVSQDRYNDAVSTRLKTLLQKQAQLRSGSKFGQPPAQLPATVVEQVDARLKADPVLMEALGSTSALKIWHKFEKTLLDDPALLKDEAPDSQARWILEALRSGYLDDLQEAARSGATQLASKKAAQALTTLKEAVDNAELLAHNGIFEDAGVSSLADVEKASTAASAALEALEQARAHDPQGAELLSRQRQAFVEKLTTLVQAHAAVPAVIDQLTRLEAAGATAL